jgi:hypothetical protein
MSAELHQQSLATEERPRPRRRKACQDGEPRAIDLIEEAMYLLRRTPLIAWAVYLCGASPFVFAFLFFWTEMVSSGLAERSLVPGAAVLGILFIWFKTTQAFFCKGLREAFYGAEGHRWTFKHWLKALRRQAFWQPTGLILLPVAFVITVPFAWAFAFYQNILMSDPSDDQDDSSLRKESWRLAKLWPEQNWIVLTLLSAVYLLSFVNWLTVLITVPFLLKTLLGIETVFSRAGVHVFNTTSLFICSVLAYLVADPLVKAVYLLRCHYCESRRSGMDLLLQLRQSVRRDNPGRASIMALTLLVIWPLSAPENVTLSASEEKTVSFVANQVDSANLGASIDRVLERREFTWRFPREETSVDTALEIGWLKSLLDTLKRWKERVEGWLEKLFNSNEKQEKQEGQNRWNGFPGSETILSYLLIAVFVIVLAYFTVRALRMYQPAKAVEGSIESDVGAVPDLNEEDVTADLLPLNRWVEMARELIANGELRLALRAYFLAQLSALASEGLIVIRLAKSNRDYANEISHRAHGQTGLLDLYRKETRLFESAWYGERPVGKEEIAEMESYLAQTGALS